MGYFSQKAIDIAERKAVLPDWSYPTEGIMLQVHLEDLLARLDELNEIRPHDPLHQLYDRYFYEDHCTHCYETPCTVQGFLKAIDEVKRIIKKREISQRESDRLFTAIESTGADPKGQLIIVDFFTPLLSETGISA